jgi:hypothetical protein
LQFPAIKGDKDMCFTSKRRNAKRFFASFDFFLKFRPPGN